MLGLLNAGLWLGAGIFFTFLVGPAFFSPEMLRLLGRPHAGAAAQIVLERYFLVHHICGVIALVQLLMEWLYSGRSLKRLLTGVVVLLFGLGLAGGLWLQPKLQSLHLAKYGVKSTPEMREAANQSFRVWHGVSQGMNLLMLVGLGWYFWSQTPGQPPRSVPSQGSGRSGWNPR